MRNIRKLASDSMVQKVVVDGVDERAAQAAHDAASTYLMHPKQWDELGESGKQLWRDVAAAVKLILLEGRSEGENAEVAKAEGELKDAIARRLGEIEDQAIRAIEPYTIHKKACPGSIICVAQ